MANKITFLKSPINYTGNKYRLLPQITSLFPKQINTFVDLFGGSGTVLLNVEADNYIYNDTNLLVGEILWKMLQQDSKLTIDLIQNIIEEYHLSRTNEEGFYKLRQDYNMGRNDWFVLYTLMCYSFNYQFRLNQKGEYNSSFGRNKSHFSSKQLENITNLNKRMSGKKVKFNFEDFSFVEHMELDENDFVYCDPPYLGSVATYNEIRNEISGWDIEKENQLLCVLDKLNEKAVKFALSNNLKYTNTLLNRWRKRYNTYHLTTNYGNCNYQQKNREGGNEILITNY